MALAGTFNSDLCGQLNDRLAKYDFLEQVGLPDLLVGCKASEERKIPRLPYKTSPQKLKNSWLMPSRGSLTSEADTRDKAKQGGCII